jgi:hypothetical protein
MPVDNLPAKRGRKPGSTMEHTIKRRAEVMSMLIKGCARDTIVNDIMEKYSVTAPSVTQDLQHCYQELRELHSGDVKDIVARHTAMCYKIFSDWDKIDPAAQLKAIDMINKMARIYAPETAVQVNNLTMNLENLSVEELKQLLGNDTK